MMIILEPGEQALWSSQHTRDQAEGRRRSSKKKIIKKLQNLKCKNSQLYNGKSAERVKKKLRKTEIYWLGSITCAVGSPWMKEVPSFSGVRVRIGRSFGSRTWTKTRVIKLVNKLLWDLSTSESWAINYGHWKLLSTKANFSGAQKIATLRVLVHVA